jgi:hypothetical protein
MLTGRIDVFCEVLSMFLVTVSGIVVLAKLAEKP